MQTINYSKPTAIRIPKGMREALDRIADETKSDRSKLIRDAIREFVEKHENLLGGP